MIKNITPFSFVQDISHSKKNLFKKTSGAEKIYNPWLTNIALSRFMDSILFINRVNEMPHMPARWQHDYLFHSLRPRKRFEKWVKRNEDDESFLSLIMEYYKCSRREAIIYSEFLPKEEVEKMKEYFSSKMIKEDT